MGLSKIHYAGVAMLLTAATQALAAGDELPLAGKSVWRLADVRQGVEAISRRDSFTNSLSPFDRQVRLKTDQDVTDATVIQNMADQVLAWEDDEKKLLAEVAASLEAKLRPWQLPLPEVVLLVKTTGKEEANAAYCRGPAVVLPKAKLEQSAERLERLVTHELFHVLSNQNPALRQQLYAIVGFHPCGEIALPESLAKRRITNPDAPTLDYYIDVKHGDEQLSLVPILYANAETYDMARGGGLFSYLTFRLLQIEKQGDAWQPKLVLGEPVLFEAEKLPNFGEQIGANTRYIIHPEEVLADNFVLLVNQEKKLATPRIVNEMDQVLKGS